MAIELLTKSICCILYTTIKSVILYGTTITVIINVDGMVKLIIINRGGRNRIIQKYMFPIGRFAGVALICRSRGF